jgi:hypothetical protein
MANTPYNTQNTVLRAADLTAVSIAAGGTYAQADLVNIKAKLSEYDALLKAMGASANQIS